ncbi:type II secretion system F family protein [Clostridia bacterium]|nr:type II secretion system F family protein [Clostridia bacterium]
MQFQKSCLNWVRTSRFGRFHQQAKIKLGLESDQASFEEYIEKKIRVQLLIVLIGFGLAFLIKEKSIFLLMVMSYFNLKEELSLYKSAKKLTRAYRRAFPVYISNLIIFLEAGYSMEMALRKSAEIGANNPLKELFRKAFKEIDNGEQRDKAFRDMVAKAKDSYISKLIFMAEQGMRIGKRQVMPGLEALSSKCWREQMDLIREDSAKASSKMVFPMIMMFISIAILALAPGIITLSSAF